MALPAADLDYLRSELGADTPPTDADLETTYNELAGLTDDPLNGTVARWLERKLADLLNQPESFTVPGQYSESNGAVIRALETKAARFRSTPGGMAVARLRRPDRTRGIRHRRGSGDLLLP